MRWWQWGWWGIPIGDDDCGVDGHDVNAAHNNDEGDDNGDAKGIDDEGDDNGDAKGNHDDDYDAHRLWAKNGRGVKADVLLLSIVQWNFRIIYLNYDDDDDDHDVEGADDDDDSDDDDDDDEYVDIQGRCSMLIVMGFTVQNVNYAMVDLIPTKALNSIFNLYFQKFVL